MNYFLVELNIKKNPTYRKNMPYYPTTTIHLTSSLYVADSEDMRREVMLLRQQVLKLLRCVLMQSTAEAEFILPATAVSTLCECIQETSSSASLKMSALQAVPAVAKHLTPS